MAEPSPGYEARNREQTRRLTSLRRLDETALRRPVGEHWTVAVALAHIQYWDARALGALEAWRRHGIPLTLWRSDEAVVNDLRLDLWRALPPREALEQAIVTANALDGVIEVLTPAETTAVAALRPSVLERASHRDDHLSEIDEVLRRMA